MSRLLQRWRRRQRRRLDDQPPRSPLHEWLNDYAIDQRPVLRVAEFELVMLAEYVCREMGILDTQTPTRQQAEIIHSRVSEWVTGVRRQTRMRHPARRPRP